VAEVVARSPPALASSRRARREQAATPTESATRSETYIARTGNVPLPAQFLKFVGEHASKTTGAFTTTSPLSKWNLARNQGLADSFQRWAWQQLEVQDRFEPQRPDRLAAGLAIETLNGVNTLRYMRADPAASATCVECHNRLEQRPETVAMRVADGVSTGRIGSSPADGRARDQHFRSIASKRARKNTTASRHVVLGLLLCMLCIGFLVMPTWRARAPSPAARLAGEPRSSHRPLEPAPSSSTAWLSARPRQNGRQPHAIMFLDLDQFKVVNDTCGHMAGDSLLLQLGATLKDNIRGTDTLARLGR